MARKSKKVPAESAATVDYRSAGFLDSLDATREYRVTFKSGSGMNASGAALKHNFSLDPDSIESIVLE